MNHLIRQNRTLCAALSLFVAMLLGEFRLGLADGSAPASPPTADPSGVQERVVIQQKQLKPLPPRSAPAPGPTGPLPVVGGTLEPDYQYPWVVHSTGGESCGGVVIDPRWVLTAAHCVTAGTGGTSNFGNAAYRRTDPYTGVMYTEERRPVLGGADGQTALVFVHPGYAPNNNFANDIALIKLAYPFSINPYLQTVGLPRSPRQQGLVGTVASISSTAPLPAGQLAIFRAPMPGGTTPLFSIEASTTIVFASLCPGDSGSGFVTVENGRAVVRGVASKASVNTACMTPFGVADFTDVFYFHDWILQTMGMGDASLAGNTRVRWSGVAARGKIVLGCSNPNSPYVGPLNVVGVEEGAVCAGGQAQGIICQLDPNQTSPRQIVGFTMRTTTMFGVSQVTQLPFVSNLAQFSGVFPAGLPFGTGASREFTCQIGATGVTAPGERATRGRDR